MSPFERTGVATSAGATAPQPATDARRRTVPAWRDPVIVVTDLHGQYEALAWVLQRHGPQCTYVQLGDLSDDYRSLERIAGLLLDRKIPGVYGNHDFGLILAMRGKASIDRLPRVVWDYCRDLTREMEIGPYLFCHDDPTTDYETVLDAWDPRLEVLSPERARPILSACRHRAVITGHTHLSQIFTADRAIPLIPGVPCVLEAQGAPYYVTIGALADGYYASLDVATSRLTLHRVPRQVATAATAE